MEFDDLNKTITTKRLVLRRFQKSDAKKVTKLCNNYNVFKSTLNLPYPYFMEDALTWIEGHQKNLEADKSYQLAITDKKTGELYGSIALTNNKKFNQGEIAYWIGENFWGNGYATEASQAMLQFAFERKRYHKVFARCFGSNPASSRVLQKIGMKKEGILIDHIVKEEQYENLIYYGVINPKE